MKKILFAIIGFTALCACTSNSTVDSTVTTDSIAVDSVEVIDSIIVDSVL